MQAICLLVCISTRFMGYQPNYRSELTLCTYKVRGEKPRQLPCGEPMPQRLHSRKKDMSTGSRSSMSRSSSTTHPSTPHGSETITAANVSSFHGVAQRNREGQPHRGAKWATWLDLRREFNATRDILQKMDAQRARQSQRWAIWLDLRRELNATRDILRKVDAQRARMIHTLAALEISRDQALLNLSRLEASLEHAQDPDLAAASREYMPPLLPPTPPLSAISSPTVLHNSLYRNHTTGYNTSTLRIIVATTDGRVSVVQWWQSLEQRLQMRLKVHVMPSQISRDAGRCASESIPYLRGIVQAYEDIRDDDMIVFLHNHNTSWHAPVPIERYATPAALRSMKYGRAMSISSNAQREVCDARFPEHEMRQYHISCSSARRQLATLLRTEYVKEPVGGVYCFWADKFAGRGLVNTSASAPHSRTIGQVWNYAFKGTKWRGTSPPMKASMWYPCCATFFTRGWAVLRHAKDEYSQIMQNLKKACMHQWLNFPNGPAGRLLEGAWHIIFSGEDAPVPQPPFCRCGIKLCSKLPDGGADLNWGLGLGGVSTPPQRFADGADLNSAG